MPPRGRCLDAGCGLGTEAGYLASLGWDAVGVDLSEVALRKGACARDDVAFVRADICRLPLRPHWFDAVLDRGCFHYLSPTARSAYAAGLRRVLRPGGKLFLRASLRVAGVRNDIDEGVIRDTFAAWQIDRIERAEVPSDSRGLEVLVVRLVAPAMVDN